MRTVLVLLVATAVALALGHPAESKRTARYSVDVPDVRAERVERVEVTLRMDHPPADEIVLLPASEVAELTDVHAFDELGRELALAPAVVQRRTPSGLQTFSGYRLLPDPAMQELVVRHNARPGLHRPPGGEPDERWIGALEERACALALASLVLVPNCALDEVRLEVTTPETWETAVALPARLFQPADEDWWREALVAGEDLRTEELFEGVTLTSGPGTPPELALAVRRVAAELLRLFGPPRAAVPIVLVPAASDRRLIDLPASLPLAVLDAGAADEAALRRLVRALVPLWFGRNALEVIVDAAEDAWFPLGLREFLARAIPARCGLSERDFEAELEALWQSDPALRAMDPEGHDCSPNARLSFRLQSSVRVHELERRVRERGGLAPLLSGWNGRGLPPALERELAPFGEPLSFEARWSFELAERPELPQAPAAFAQVPVEIAFTIDTGGFDASCACSKSGARARDAALATLADLPPERVLRIDLGGAFPLEPGRGVFGPRASEVLRETRDLMAGLYDVLALGADDVYAGALDVVLEQRGSPGARLHPRWVGGGLRVDGRELPAGSAVLSLRGLKIGFVGLNEHLLPAALFEPEERNARGVTFPRDVSAVFDELARLRPEVDLLITGGRMRPETLRALADLGIVDLVLAAGLELSLGIDGELDQEREGISAGFLKRTAVAFDQHAGEGVNRVTLFLSERGEVLGIEAR